MTGDPRDRYRALAERALAVGAPTTWFEELYRESGGDAAAIPWADGQPNRFLVAWAEAQGLAGAGRRALVTGCGLGDDAAYIAGRGYAVTAFDISATAVEWARRLYPMASVDWQVADLLALPPAWHAGFDLVVDVYTVQSLPPDLQPAAIAATAACVAPGGRVFATCRSRDEHATPSGPPWPLAPSTLRRYAATGLIETLFEGWLDESETPPQPRLSAVFARLG